MATRAYTITVEDDGEFFGFAGTSQGGEMLAFGSMHTVLRAIEYHEKTHSIEEISRLIDGDPWGTDSRPSANN